jgi:hypothetical protein
MPIGNSRRKESPPTRYEDHEGDLVKKVGCQVTGQSRKR